MMFKRFLLPLFATLLLIGQANAGDFIVPKQSLSGIDLPVELGELVDISVTPIPEKNKPQHFIGVMHEWRVFEIVPNARTKQLEFKDKRFRTNGQGEIITFGSGVIARRLFIEVNLTYMYGVKNEKGDAYIELGVRTTRLSGVLDIGGAVPPAPLPPGPEPVLPDGKFKLAKKAYDAAMSRVSADANREKAAVALANSFRGMASAIAAGTLKEAKEILQKTTESNRSAVNTAGVSPEVWVPFFRDIQDVIFQLYEDNTLNTPDDFRQAWLEIADGLNRVR